MDKRRLTALFVGISCLAALGFAAAGCNQGGGTDSGSEASPAASASAADTSASPAAGTAASPAAGTDASPAAAPSTK